MAYILRAVDTLLAKDMEPEAKLRLHMDAVVDTFFRTPYIHRLLMRLIREGEPAEAQRLADSYLKPLLQAYDRLIERLERSPLAPLAAVIGPPGPPGAGGAPVRLDAPLAATWILPHSLGRVPVVQIFLESGEAVLTDVAADTAHVTVTFPTPQQGFALVF